jgi:invasion protein IalB
MLHRRMINSLAVVGALGIAAAGAVALGVVLSGAIEAQSPKPERGAQRPQTPAPAARPTTPAPATEAALPVRTETVVYNAWTVTCRDTVGGAAKPTCSADFKVIDKERRNVLLQWIIARNSEGTLFTVFQTPTGILIQNGVDLKLGNAAARKLNYVACQPNGCESSIAMDEAMIRELAGATDAVATIYATDGRSISSNMPIKGVDQALAALLK